MAYKMSWDKLMRPWPESSRKEKGDEAKPGERHTEQLLSCAVTLPGGEQPSSGFKLQGSQPAAAVVVLLTQLCYFSSRSIWIIIRHQGIEQHTHQSNF